MNYKKLFLRILIIALTGSAGIGIAIFLFGEFDNTEINILLSTLSIGAFSLTGLACAAVNHKPGFRLFSFIGMLASTVTFIFCLYLIWGSIEFEDSFWQTFLISLVLTIATAHVSLLLLMTPRSKEVRRMMEATILIITAVAVLIIFMILFLIEDEFYFRLLGVLAILDVLGTIATPIWNRMGADKNS